MIAERQTKQNYVKKRIDIRNDNNERNINTKIGIMIATMTMQQGWYKNIVSIEIELRIVMTMSF